MSLLKYGKSRYVLPLAVTVGIFILDLLTPLSVIAWIGYSIFLFFSFRRFGHNFLLLYGAVSTVLIVLGFFLVPPGNMSEHAIFDRGFGIAILWLIVVFLMRHEQAQSALQASEERYRSLFNGMTEGFALHELICDSEGKPCDYRFLEVNPSFERLTGLERRAVIGKTKRELLAGDDVYWLELYGEVVFTGQPTRFETHSASRDKHYEVFVFCPAPGQFAVLLMDVTARKKAEAALQEAHAELERRVVERTDELARTINVLHEEIWGREEVEKALVISIKETQDLYNHAPCGYHSLNKDGIIVRINDTELHWMGYTGEDVLGRPLTEFLTPSSREQFGETFPRFKREGVVRDLEMEFVRKDGSIMPVLLSATAVPDSDGNYLMSRSTIFDITERRAAEQKLREKDRILMQQSRHAAMGEMIGNIAHQWRQPLNTLGLHIQRLPVYYETDEFSREFLEESVDEAMKLVYHISQTINDFRNFFRPDKQKIPFAVNTAVSQALSLSEGSLRDQRIKTIVTGEGNPLAVGYPNEFSQALLIILNNARDACVERRVADAQVAIDSFVAGQRVVVTITDNAGGIGEDILEKIFDPYFTTKGPDQGTGVGLFMAKTIVETNMGGRLIACNVADGAQFRIEVAHDAIP